MVRPCDVASLPWIEVKQLWCDSMALLSEALAEAAGDAASPAHRKVVRTLAEMRQVCCDVISCMPSLLRGRGMAHGSPEKCASHVLSKCCRARSCILRTTRAIQTRSTTSTTTGTRLSGLPSSAPLSCCCIVRGWEQGPIFDPEHAQGPAGC